MNKATLRSVLRDAWRLTRPYFTSEERWAARGLLLAIIAMNLLSVAGTVLLNFWRGDFYNALQQKNAGDFTQLILFWRWGEDGFMPGFVPIVCVLVPLGVYTTYLTQLLQIRWRVWMTKRTLASWLSDRAYYTIGLKQSPVAATSIDGAEAIATSDNPDQRIADDIRSFTADTVSLGLDLLSTVVSLVSFAQILWTISGVVTVFGVRVPGYMLFIAIAYAVVGSVLVHLVGRPLALLEFFRQRFEANFRFALVRVRENTEGVALYGGEGAEQTGLLARFSDVVLNFRRTMNRTKLLNFVSLVYAQAAAVFPIVIAAPRYFAGAIELGGLMRVAGAFSQVNSSLSWFIQSYPSLAAWRATVGRLTGFRVALDTAHGLAGAGVHVATGAAGSGVAAHGITIGLPDGRMLMQDGTFDLPAGRSTVISGRSGSGKSTLFRAIAGIWPFGSGTVQRAPGSHLFLPQRPYIPLGTLRQAVTYPAEPGAVPDADVRQALGQAGLGTLVDELDSEQPWAQRLSGGEQQRVAIARALLTRPDWLYMDEATASLDPEAEAELYAMLRRELPGTTILSIAHRPEVAQWHDAAVRLAGGALTAA